MDTLTYSLQIAISAMFFGRWHLESRVLSILLAAQVLLLIWKVLFCLSPPFPPTLPSAANSQLVSGHPLILEP